MRSAGRWLGALASAVWLSACVAGSVKKRVRAGDYAGAIETAADAKRPVRHAAARALARAYEALGDVDAARAVLAADFERGGDLASLVALARLEAAAGLEGVAAARWTMVAGLDPRLLAEEPEACRLLYLRGALRTLVDESGAAEEDLAVAERWCPDASRAPDRAQVHALREANYGDAIADLVQRNAAWRCAPTQCEAWGGRVPAAGPTAPEGERPSDGRARARRFVAAAQRELQGMAPTAVPMSDEVARRLLGYASLEDVNAALHDRAPAVGAYVRLRLSRLWPEARLDPQAEMALRVRLDASPDVSNRWLIRWLEGDDTFVKLELTTRLRPRAAEVVTGGRSSVAVGAAGPTPHWSARVPVDEDSVRPLLALARMMDREGALARALAIRARVASTQLDRDRGWGPLLEQEVRSLLTRGQPWSALWIAGALSVESRARAARGAWAWIGLATAVCPDRCGVDEDRARVAALAAPDQMRSLGASLAAAGRAASPAQSGVGPASDCGRLWERMLDGDDWAAPLIRAAETGKLSADVVAARIESDLLLGCGGRLATERLALAGEAAVIERLLDRRMQAFQTSSAIAIESEAVLLLAAAQPRRAAARFEAAAAMSGDPRAVWLRAWGVAEALDAREVSVQALREMVLLSGDDEADRVREHLRLTPLMDVLLERQVVVVPENEGGMPGADARRATERTAITHAVDRWLERGSLEGDSWGRADALLQLLGRRASDKRMAGRLAAVEVLRDRIPIARHEAAFFRLASPRDLWAATAGRDAPLAGPSACAATPRADAPDISPSTACLAAIVGGDPVTAARAMSSLLQRVPPGARAAALAWMGSRPRGWAMSSDGSLFPDPEINLRLALGLSVEGWGILGGPRLDRTQFPTADTSER